MMEYNNAVVFLSYGISFLGAYLTISLCEQLRIHSLKSKDHSLVSKLFWCLLMGISLGGVGIWSMHFIGMSAMQLYNEQNQRVHLSFNIPLTILSLIIAIIVTTIGVFLLSRDHLFAKSKNEIFEMFIDDLRHLSFAELKRSKNKMMLWIIMTKNIGSLTVGGILTGGGVSLMHYIGMMAVTFEGDIHWNPGIVTASVLVGIFAACAAFWILFRLLSIYSDFEGLRLVSAIIMGAAVCGMHYTAMEASTFHFNATAASSTTSVAAPRSRQLVPDEEVLLPVAIVAVTILALLMIFLFADLRTCVHHYQHLAKRKSLPNYHRPSRAQQSLFEENPTNGTRTTPLVKQSSQFSLNLSSRSDWSWMHPFRRSRRVRGAQVAVSSIESDHTNRITEVSDDPDDEGLRRLSTML